MHMTLWFWGLFLLLKAAISTAQTTPVFSEVLNGETYALYTDSSFNFSEVDILCQNVGGQLAKISSLEEFNFIRNIQIITENPFMWVGIDAIGDTQNSGVNRFTFTDGSTEGLDFIRTDIGLFPWDINEPALNFDSGEECVM